MNDHKKYYQILIDFKKTLGVDDEEFAELIRMEPERLKDCVDTCQKPLIGTFASTASGLFRAVDSAREDEAGASADALHSLYSQLIEEYVRLNPDQFEPGLNSYLAKSLEDLADRTGSRELTETVRQLLGWKSLKRRNMEKFPIPTRLLRGGVLMTWLLPGLLLLFRMIRSSFQMIRI